MTPDELCERLLNFSARIGKVVDGIPDTRMGRESRADFIHKLKIVLKESRETRFWLRLLVKTELMPPNKLNDLIDEANQLCNIFGKSIVTAKGVERKRIDKLKE